MDSRSPFVGAENGAARLAQLAGIEIPAIAAARQRTEAGLAQLRPRLASVLEHDDDCALAFVGSWGRAELTGDSDDDWLIVVGGDPRTGVQPDPAAVAAALDGPPPGRENLFGQVAFAGQLAGDIGLQADTNANLTRRLLLLLESCPVTGADTWHATREAILDGYLATRSRDHRPPLFLLNDVVRYWRTIAVDFEGKDRARGGTGWGLRNGKLRTSRKLLFASALLPILECHRLTRPQMHEYLRAQFAAPPLDRVAAAFIAYEAVDPGARLLAGYDRFLQLLDDPDTRAELSALAEADSHASAVFGEVRAIADQVQAALLALLFDDTRLAKVTREYAVF
ncbi:MAG TPA: hypothetical protein VNT22_02635 [Baekduia sp.]|nr:hypothetical protein [Baekduia sp.]